MKTIECYVSPNGCKYIYGQKIDDDKKYLDYGTMAKIVGSHILNNNIMNVVSDWELYTGDYDGDDEFFQYYIIDEYGAYLLRNLTEETVWYSEEIDMYVWGITHFGTAWEYVDSDIEIVCEK